VPIPIPSNAPADQIEIDRDQKGDAFHQRGEALYHRAVADEVRRSAIGFDYRVPLFLAP
jgi:hypothetical protein